MIHNIYKQKKTVFSVEVFPPKKEDEFPDLYQTLEELKKLNVDFISVTYGAAGSNSKKTAAIASYIQNICGIEALAHLTCTAMDETLLLCMLNELGQNGVHNILPLRSDKPADMTEEEFQNRTYKHASDIIPIIRKQMPASIAGACYPEKHTEAASFEEDILFLKQKTEQGVDFLLTQLFFDNSVFYRFMEQIRRENIMLPVSAGIMPVLSRKQIETTLKLSGAAIPEELADLFRRYSSNEKDFRKAGLDYAVRQIEDLISHGVEGIHLYTMNRLETADVILKNFI